jgi:hypothetical protein
MPAIVAVIVVAVMAALSVLHIYWGLGGRAARSAAVPEVAGRPSFTPTKWATFAVAAALLFAAIVVAMAGRLLGSDIPAPLTRLLACGLAATFIARGVGDFRLVGLFKRVRDTRFARLDSWVYAPLCLALGAAVAYIAYNDG